MLISFKSADQLIKRVNTNSKPVGSSLFSLSLIFRSWTWKAWGFEHRWGTFKSLCLLCVRCEQEGNGLAVSTGCTKRACFWLIECKRLWTGPFRHTGTGQVLSDTLLEGFLFRPSFLTVTHQRIKSLVQQSSSVLLNWNYKMTRMWWSNKCIIMYNLYCY